MIDRCIKNKNDNDLNIIDYFESVVNRIYNYRGSKQIIFITSNPSSLALVDLPENKIKLHKLIRFMRNSDVSVQIINFNKNLYSAGKEFSKYFYDAYYQYPSIVPQEIIKNINSYKSGNYSIYYVSKNKNQALATWINQFISLRFRSKFSELRSGYFIP